MLDRIVKGSVFAKVPKNENMPQVVHLEADPKAEYTIKLEEQQAIYYECGGDRDVIHFNKLDNPGGFIYLADRENALNVVQTDAYDVVSGNFSGCIMAAFEFNGLRYVGHVFIGKNFGDKIKWHEFALRRGVKILTTFQPWQAGANPPEVEKGHSYCSTFGIITKDNVCYSVQYSIDMSIQPVKYKIVAITERQNENLI